MTDTIDSAVNQDIDKDSLSSESISHDSLIDEHQDHNRTSNTNRVKRKGSYTIEDSSQALPTVPILNPSKTDNTSHNEKDIRNLRSAIEQSLTNPKNQMTQSMFERPWESGKRNASVASALAKQREEKIRLAKEEQQRRQKQKLASLNETKKMTESVMKRKDEEKQRKIEEKRLKDKERLRVVEERKQRLAHAEEARKAQLLQKLLGKDGSSSQKKSNVTSGRGGTSNTESLMTMSCYGGLGNRGAPLRATTGRLKKEVVPRFRQTRPTTSTGKIIGFGSSVPRKCIDPIDDEDGSKKKKKTVVPDWLMERLEVLSRPSTARSTASTASTMTASVMMDAPRKTSTLGRSSFREKPPNKKYTRPMTRNTGNSMMTTSMIDYSTKNMSNGNRLSPKANQNKSDKSQVSPKPRLVHSSSFSKTKSRPMRKVDQHLDSDSIDEENTTANVSMATSISSRRSAPITKKKPTTPTNKPAPKLTPTNNRNPAPMKKSLMTKSTITRKAKSDFSSGDSMDVSKKTAPVSNNKTQGDNMITAKSSGDTPESDYRARLLENRRIAREKREREREQKMKEAEEKEKRMIEEASQLDRSKQTAAHQVVIPPVPRTDDGSSEEGVHLTPTSNDDTSGIADTQIDDYADEEDKSLIKDQAEEISPGNPTFIVENPDHDEDVPKSDESGNNAKASTQDSDTKKRLESIMSRFKRASPVQSPANNGEDSSQSDGLDSTSPRRAMSPEPSELDPQTQATGTALQFKSSILQSMVNKGKLSASKQLGAASQEMEPVKSTPAALSALRESIEDNDSVDMNQHSKSSAAIRSSGVDANSLSDVYSDFGQEIAPPVFSVNSDSQQKIDAPSSSENAEESIPDHTQFQDTPKSSPSPYDIDQGQTNGHHQPNSSVSETDEDLSLCATNVNANSNPATMLLGQN